VEWSWTIAKQKFVEWSWRWSGVCGVELRFLEWSSPKQPLTSLLPSEGFYDFQNKNSCNKY
jgi:hypothetical protein